uniref:MOSC domain-containing protein n=1 Tax=Rhabditophanes sp. KR3021 TaxID=114890 RepID=A0AC35TRT9_9BILA
MKGIRVPYIECTRTGSQYNQIKDRSFIVYDQTKNEYISAKTFKKLFAIQPSFENGILTLTVNDKSIKIDVKKVVDNGDVRSIICYEKDLAEGYDCGDKVSLFLKGFLQTSDELRLAYYSEGLFKQRIANIDDIWTLNKPPPGPHELRYQDEGPYMVMTTASLKDLNKRIGSELLINRFRPSILIKGSEPYAEDFWNKLSIGKVEMSYLKPCTRCVMTMINDEGVSNKNMEPLRELRKYRLAPGKLRKVYGESPVLGGIFGIDEGGIIKEGDSVYAMLKDIPC